MVTLAQYLKNLLVFPPRTRRVFSNSVMDNIEAAIVGAEAVQGCEIRFVVEGALPLRYLRRTEPLRERADDLFSQLKIWNTEKNNGILFYVVLSEQTFHLVADRGVNHALTATDWDEISSTLSREFQTGHYEQAVLAGIRLLSQALAPHFPGCVKHSELPNVPLAF